MAYMQRELEFAKAVRQVLSELKCEFPELRLTKGELYFNIQNQSRYLKVELGARGQGRVKSASYAWLEPAAEALMAATQECPNPYDTQGATNGTSNYTETVPPGRRAAGEDGQPAA